MPRETIFRCKICTVIKTGNNHWYVVEQTKVGLHIHTWNWAVQEQQLDKDGIEYLCGQACAHKLVDQFLAESQLPDQNQPSAS